MDRNTAIPRNTLQNRHIRELPVKIVMTVLLSIIAVMMVVPFIWMLSASFKYATGSNSDNLSAIGSYGRTFRYSPCPS